MANIVVTSTTNSIKAVFNDLSSSAGMEKGAWSKGRFHFELLSDRIIVDYAGMHAWEVCYSTTDGAMIIDSVDTVSLSSLSDLYDKLVALIA